MTQPWQLLDTYMGRPNLNVPPGNVVTLLGSVLPGAAFAAIFFILLILLRNFLFKLFVLAPFLMHF